MSHPEMPYLAAGGVAIVGATMRDGHLPPLGRPLIGIVVLVIVASATGGTRVAPLVRAIGFLLLLTTTMAAANVVIAKASSNKKDKKK